MIIMIRSKNYLTLKKWTFYKRLIQIFSKNKFIFDNNKLKDVLSKIQLINDTTSAQDKEKVFESFITDLSNSNVLSIAKFG